jgi:N-acyl-D-amino-acid deacylase
VTPDIHTTVDQIMNSTLASTGVSAATVTIIKNGNVIVDQGYGHLDAAGTIALPASALMTTASIVKPVTAAAIQQLASKGKLALTDNVFCTGSNAPCWLPANLLSSTSDSRVGTITVGDLIAHQGGWDISQHNNVDFDKQESIVQSTLGITTPPTQDDDIRYWMARPLDFTPGTQVAYSNFGYMLLGRVVALASGSDYLSYIQSQVLGPVGVASADFSGAASLLANRNPREPNYITSQMGPSLFVPGTTVIVTNGAINAPNWVSATTAITTSKAMAAFAANYLIKTNAGVDMAQNGQPLNGTTNSGYHFGNYPGTSSIVRQLPSGVSYAVLMNKSNETAGQPGYQPALMNSLDSAIAAAGF